MPDTIPIPGPANRVAFFEEQRRRRQQTWRFTALSAIAAAIVGVPLAMFLTPVVYLFTVVALRLVDRWSNVPDAVWSAMRNLAGFVPAFLSALSDAPDEEVLPWLQYALRSVEYPFGSPVLTVVALVGPGMAAMVVIWLAYRALFRQAGVGGTLLSLGAREPRLDDFEERQLVNLVEEMALAAGLPPPQVRLLDSEVSNAAAIGPSHDQAVLIVTRGLLDRLDRDEAQGVIAHLIGSTGNGDLPIALSLTTIFQSIELVFTVLEALFNLSGSAWRDLFWTARLVISGGSDKGAAEKVSRMMDHRLGEMRDDGISGLLGESEEQSPRSWLARLLKRLPMLYVVFMPFLLLYILALFLRMQVSMFRITFIGRLLMRVWRTRRFLADATAVELTRNPEGLARALTRLRDAGEAVPGGQWFAHLFIVGPATGASWAKEMAGAASHPSMSARLHRLGLLGATFQSVGRTGPAPAPPVAAARFGGRSILGLVAFVIMLPLMVLAAFLMAFAMSGIFMFGLVAALFFMGMAMAGIYALLT